MMELVGMPGMSAKFRICRIRTANSKTVGGTLNGNFRALKLGVPKLLVGDRFCIRGGALREKSTLLYFLRSLHTNASPASTTRVALVKCVVEYVQEPYES